MTVLSALEISGNYPENILVEAVQSSDNSKWAGYVYMLRSGSIHKLMLNSEPEFENEQICMDKFHEMLTKIKNHFLTL